MKLAYAVVFEQTTTNYAAYAPEVPGCIGPAKTWDEMLAIIREALTFHIGSLIEDNDPISESMTSIDDAIAYHSKEPAKADEVLLAGYIEAPPTISTPFGMVQIEVSALQTPDRLDLTRFSGGKVWG